MDRASSSLSQSSILSDGTYDVVVNSLGIGSIDSLLKDNNLFEFIADDNGFLIDQVLNMHPEPSATSQVPCFSNYPGPYRFRHEVQSETPDRAKWLYSMPLNKLFVNKFSTIPINFKWDPLEKNLYIRALLVFTSEDYHKCPVIRCPRHSRPEEESNKDFPYPDHVIRCEHEGAVYVTDPESKRLSVVVPAETDGQTVNYFFTCKNSCATGMNRRSTAIIFTLERYSGQVIGRQMMKVRICSCPKRDKDKEENDQDRRSLADLEAPPGKRLKTEETPRKRKYTFLNPDGKTVNLLVHKERAASFAAAGCGIVLREAFKEKRKLTKAEEMLLEQYKKIIATYGSGNAD